MAQAQEIAQHNHQRFFSQDFFNQMIDELKTNLISAFIELLNNPKNYKIDHWNKLALLPEIINFVSTNKDTHYPTKSDLDFILNLLKRTK